MIIEIQPIHVYIGMAIGGTFIGLGTALGQYLFTKFKEHAIERKKKLSMIKKHLRGIKWLK